MSETCRIKPLVWEEIRNHPRDRIKARTVFAEFVIGDLKDGSFYLDLPWRGELVVCDSVDGGKAKAEAYYRERLMQALEKVPFEFENRDEAVHGCPVTPGRSSG